MSGIPEGMKESKKSGGDGCRSGSRVLCNLLGDDASSEEFQPLPLITEQHNRPLTCFDKTDSFLATISLEVCIRQMHKHDKHVKCVEATVRKNKTVNK